jgi:hypothetical protein
MASLPFARKTAREYKKEPYYWRGGDILREREYLADEHKKALAKFRRADFELKHVEQELRQATNCLCEREEYSTSLANGRDSFAQSGQVEGEWKPRLEILEVQIKEAEAELYETRAVHHPVVESGSEIDKDYLVIENHRTFKAIDLSEEQTTRAKRQLAACTVSTNYWLALSFGTKLDELARKRSFLRHLVNRSKREFDATHPVNPPQTEDTQKERAALLSQIDLEESILRGEEKRKRRRLTWEMRLKRMIKAIDELNGRLTDLGLVDDVVDTDELRARFLLNNAESTGDGREGNTE